MGSSSLIHIVEILTKLRQVRLILNLSSRSTPIPPLSNTIAAGGWELIVGEKRMSQ